MHESVVFFVTAGADPDMLEVGNGGMTNSEYVVHFSLWAISKVTAGSFFPPSVLHSAAGNRHFIL